MLNRQFGRLTVIKQEESDKNRNSRWLCQCTCGNFITVLGMSLKNGNTKSCGCFKKDLKEDAGYHGIHNWVRRNKSRPELCERCKKKQIKKLSSKLPRGSKAPSRNMDDYEWLCNSCYNLKRSSLILTKAEILTIRKLYATNKLFTQRVLALLFNVSIKTIRKTVKNS